MYRRLIIFFQQRWQNKVIKACFTGLVCLVCSVVFSINLSAQDAATDSLRNIVSRGKNDSTTVNALISLAIANVQTLPEQALADANRAKEIAQKINFKKGEAYAYKWLGIINNNKGNYYEALVNSNLSLNLFRSIDDKAGTSNLLNNLGALYADKDENSKAVEYYLQALDLARQSENKLRIGSTLGNIGVIYSKNTATIDSALSYYKQALPYATETKDVESTGILYTNIGEVYTVKKDYAQAHQYYNKAVETLGESSTLAYTFNDIGKLYLSQKNFDSASAFFERGYEIAKQNESPVDILQSLTGQAQLQLAQSRFPLAIQLFQQALQDGRSTELTPELKPIFQGLSEAYQKSGDCKNALLYQTSINRLYDTLYERKLSFNTATLEYTMELQKQTGKIAVLQKENEQQGVNLANEKFARNAALSALFVLLIVTVLLLRNITQRKKLNRLLSIQKHQIEVQKQNVEKALTDLKATQSQLIHSEKMASLGELSTGIAHEIQNPLNFVNNFSEVSSEMIDEMFESLQQDNKEDAFAIAADVKDNLKKILYHGKRADSIVKGLLQHTRTSAGKKEPTDVNALVDEYMRLSHQGLRAKNQTINVAVKTNFEEPLPKVSLVAQDMSRVLINLFNNAFYAVNEKKNLLNGSFEPLVTVATRRNGSRVEIVVEDNGSGIPKGIIEKVFQPFFTTKPTGQGTGLGLSLSYDVIRSHGGEISVSSQEGEGSTFVISLPIA